MLLTALYISGEWVAGSGSTVDSVDPFTEETNATVRGASVTQVHKAVTAVAEGNEMACGGADQPRSAHRHSAPSHESANDRIDRGRCRGNRARIALAKAMQFGFAADQVAWLADAAFRWPRGDWQYELPAHSGPFGELRSRIRREPIGVVAGITAYNVPYSGAAMNTCADSAHSGAEGEPMAICIDSKRGPKRGESFGDNKIYCWEQIKTLTSVQLFRSGAPR